jgi:hypothetical protein
MDLKIVEMSGDPPQWRLYLNQFFIVCMSEEQASALLQQVADSERRPASRPPRATTSLSCAAGCGSGS